MKTFIRVVEVWLPDADHTLLEFGSGWYSDTRGFGAASRQMCFGRGEGLPGRAWEQRRPIVLKQLEDSSFRRSRAAAAEGLTCGIALPVFAGDVLRAVLLILCGDDAAHVGAIELWHNAADSPDLVLDDGYYGGTAEVFEFLSRCTQFRRGTGLPGAAWDSGAPVFLPDLGQGTRFLRADSAQQVGINRGLALPCPVPGPDTWVMAFLSALATPIVRRLEIWRSDDAAVAAARLRRTDGYCEIEGELGALAVGEPLDASGVLARAATSGVPCVVQPAADEPGAVGFAARGAGLRAVLALPLPLPATGVAPARVGAIVLWYF